MRYKKVYEAVFISRPNRFIAHCLLEGEEVIAHVPNTGRCRELLRPGVRVYVEKADNPRRKTAYTLIAVDKAGRLVNIDSQAPNRVVKEGLLSRRLILPGWEGAFHIQGEALWGSSRFDFRLESQSRRAWLEVKGVTLEEEGAALFPDAPTQRGLRHVEELIQAVQGGEEAFILFVVQMEGVKYFRPNTATHAAFGEALIAAEAAGVQLLAYDCTIAPDFLELKEPVEIILS